MFPITFEINVNGRNVGLHRAEAELERAMVEDISKKMQEKGRRIRCTKHGQTARITTKGRRLKQLSFEVSGCCDELVERVKSALN